MSRRIINSLILLSLFGGVFYVWLKLPGNVAGVKKLAPLVALIAPEPCSEPIHYAIGNFDSRFGIDEADFRAAIVEAGSVWERVSGKTLFLYDPSAQFKINLFYDERQQETERLKMLAQSLAEVEQSQEILHEKQETLASRYTTTKREYESLLRKYQKQQDEFNADVEYWNDRGGAPSDEYKQLEQEKSSLKKAYQRLESKRTALNALAQSLNTTNQVETKMVESYNRDVNEYKQTYGEPQEFQEGLYTGSAIEIYQFENRSQLVLVLTHELGHALGMEHVENPTSLMYHFMSAQSDVLTPTTEDLAALRLVCGLKREAY